MSSRYPDWERDGADWPNRTASRFVDVAHHRWHVQDMGPSQAMGEGRAPPVCVLIHGTGAATHSWRGVIPLLAKDWRVIAVDLPGHGFTRTSYARSVTLPAMAAALGELLDALDVTPDIFVGHSAGAAIAAQILLDRNLATPLVGLTPALLPFPGIAARLFPTLARMLFTNPFVSIIFSRLAARPGETRRFLERSTGSRIDADGTQLYQRLFSHSGHCDGAIRMMANWQLEPLRDALPRLRSPTLLLWGGRDNAIPPSAVAGAASLIPDCEARELPGLGHLAHEEDPALAASLIAQFVQRHAPA